MIDGCGAFRTVGSNHVISANEAGSVVAGADRNHVWTVTPSGDAGGALCAVRIVAPVIARRAHYDDACFPGSFHSLAQGIDLVRGGNRTPQREVDHADVVLALEGDSRVDGCNHVRVLAIALAVQNLQVDQTGVLGDTFEPPGIVAQEVGDVIRAGCNARDVRAMTIIIASISVGWDKRLVVDDSRVSRREMSEVGVRHIDSTIDDGDSDAVGFAPADRDVVAGERVDVAYF